MNAVCLQHCRPLSATYSFHNGGAHAILKHRALETEALSEPGKMARKRILLIEDDTAIREGIVDALQFEGYAVLQTADGVEGLRMAEQVDYELLLLDLTLPGRDGLDILQAVRSTRPTQPVIILTARGQESDRVGGLKLGADDYMVKPFSARELLARIEAVLRRSPERPCDVSTVTISGGQIDLQAREVRMDDGRRNSLSQREVELLRYLACNGGRAITREEILARVWRMDPAGVETRTIDMHIARLREKIENDPSRPCNLITVRGQGYRFAGEETT